MNMWWIGPRGSVEAAFCVVPNPWKRYQIAPDGSAALTSGLTCLSREPITEELWWISPNGSVKGAFWYEGFDTWKRHQIAPPGSAALTSGVKAQSRIPAAMNMWWIGPRGSVEGAFTIVPNPWKRYQIAPDDRAALTSGIAATSRIPNSEEIWWVAPSGALMDAYWYEGAPWKVFELAPPGRARVNTRIAALSRQDDTMEVFFTGANGALCDQFWYDWGTRTLQGTISSGGLAALGGWATMFIKGDGYYRWNGNGHNSGMDGYHYHVTAVLNPKPKDAISNGPIVMLHQGYVGGTFTSGSQYAEGKFEFYTEYTSSIGQAFESALGLLAKYVVGTALSGVGLIVFVGVEVGSLIKTGSLVPGARVLSGILWLAGPSNTLLSMAAAGIAAAGSRTREMTQAEYDWANREVYGSGLPPRQRIIITDTIGADNRAFVFPRFDGKITLNLGPEGFPNPMGWVKGKYTTPGEVFIHELCHAWQIAHTNLELALLADALVNQVRGSDSYRYGPAGPRFSDFNLEAQASIVNEWWSGAKTGTKKDENSPYYIYIVHNIRQGYLG
ncbi:hypothetical protein H2199_006318 [Coniosporium tulheliwenetii]|uniref:Uncharacterized protein n=1 Tax=Coniosporium tulheliwenetii TaxID=3383036 RepID=A0ACC2YXF0_9PEZI|nr:hypothetical protein H2199_006318 [Cladosporium sp. JES 115]